MQIIFNLVEEMETLPILDTESENTDGDEGDGHSAGEAQSDPEYEPDDQEDDEDSSGDDGDDYQDLDTFQPSQKTEKSLNYVAITDRKTIPSEPKNDATTVLKKTYDDLEVKVDLDRGSLPVYSAV
jgi:hypothetical protein